MTTHTPLGYVAAPYHPKAEEMHASAPELLKACKELLKSLVWLGGVTYIAKEAAIAPVRDAIRRAEGE